MLLKCYTEYVSKFGKLSSGHKDWKRSLFIPIPKKGNAKEGSDYCTIALISPASKIMPKFSKLGFNSLWTENFQMFKLDLEKAEGPEIKLPTCPESSKKQESSRKISTSALLTRPKPLTVWITTNWRILQEIGIPDHLTCLLRNLYAGQEATVRTRRGITERFQIGKGVCQGCILSLCLLNLYAVYIMQNAGLYETKGGIKIVRRMSATSHMQMTPPLWQKVKRNWKASWWMWKRIVKKLS